MKFQIGNLSEEDKERAVLPAIVFATDKTETIRGFVIGIGWWKWGIRIGHFWRRKK